MNIADVAAKIISRARQRGDSADAFDYQIATEGLRPFGELYQETYGLANEPDGQVRPGDGDAALAERKDRAKRLWEQVLPELEIYAADRRAARYTGWSRESGGPIRRLR